MLQQTTVKAVVPYYESFVERFLDVDALAGAREDDVVAAWSGLGYYHRARNLHRGATHVRDSTRALPTDAGGGARRSRRWALHRERDPVDRVRRRAARRGWQRATRAGPAFALRGPKWRKDGRTTTAQEVLAQDTPGDWNQAVMELGALVCTPRQPACAACPLRRGAAARSSWASWTGCPRPRASRAGARDCRGSSGRASGAHPARPARGGPPHGPHVGGSQTSLESRGLPDLVTELRERHGLEVPRSCASARHAITFRRIRVEAYEARLASQPPADPNAACGRARRRSARCRCRPHPQGRPTSRRRSFPFNWSDPMFRTVLKVLLVAAVLAGVWAYNRWPVINDVETGQTPEYPDLKVRDYMTSEDKVAKAARATVERLAWTFVAQALGGTEIQAIARTRVWRFKDDVTIRVRREGVERASACGPSPASAGPTSARTPATSSFSCASWTRSCSGSGAANRCRLADRGKRRPMTGAHLLGDRGGAHPRQGRVPGRRRPGLPRHQPPGPVHVLVIPKRHITSLLDLEPGDDETVGRLVRSATASSSGCRSAASALSSTAATTRLQRVLHPRAPRRRAQARLAAGIAKRPERGGSLEPSAVHA